MSSATHDLQSAPTTLARRPPTPPDAMRGRLLGGRFRVVGRLAVTAMSRVYQGLDEHTGARVAIKVLECRDPRPEVQRTFRRRFAREADALARLTHPHVVKVLDHGIADDIPYLVMAFLDGRSLETALRARTPRPVAALAVAEQVCRALAAAHEHGVVHRDIKPSNLFVTGDLDGPRLLHVRLIDFGIAKDLTDASDLTGQGIVVGTPRYMAPEQTLGDPVDGRADIYAVGCLLFRMLLGSTPFEDRRGTGVLLAHVTQPPPLFSAVRPELSLPPVIEWTVRRCLEKDPDRRFADVAELRCALQLCRRSLDNPDFRPRLELVAGRVRMATRESPPRRPVSRSRGVDQVGVLDDDPDTLRLRMVDAGVPLDPARVLHWTALGFLIGGLAFWVAWLVLIA